MNSICHFRGNVGIESTISVKEMVDGMELDQNQKEELLKKLERNSRKVKKNKKEGSKDQNLSKKMKVNSLDSSCTKVNIYIIVGAKHKLMAIPNTFHIKIIMNQIKNMFLGT